MIATLSIQSAKQYYDTLFYKNAEYFLANSSQIDIIHGWFCDEESKRLYAQSIRNALLSSFYGEQGAHNLAPIISNEQWQTALQQYEQHKANFPAILTPLPHELPVLFAETFILEQYRYKDVVCVSEGEVFIDCGAFLGETSIWAALHGAKTVMPVEPNPNNFEYVLKNLGNTDNFPADCTAIPLQLGISHTRGETSCLLQAASSRLTESPEGTRASSANELHVPTNSIDALMEEHGISPTFIKMDIEGFELAALHGAQQTLLAQKPKLAISLYHKTSDLIDIPLYIKTLVPEYRLYLKKSHPLYETVLFAIA